MAIPVTAFHADRLREQIGRNLIGLHSDIYRNAATHKAMALAQNPPLATLQSYWSSAVASYQQRTGWVATLQGNPTNLAIAVTALQRIGLSTTDVTDILSPLNTAIAGMAAANISSYALIASACDQVASFLGPPISLWPE